MKLFISNKLLILALTVWSTAGIAAPEAKLISFWVPSNEKNVTPIDHVRWQSILDRYLLAGHPSGINRFNYGGITHKDKTLLTDYLQDLQSMDPRTYSRKVQKSYWINLYNALTVNLVSNQYPVESIKKLGKGFFSFGPWNDSIVVVQSQKLSLNDIEHGILRPIWKDNRIHYAVNCASLSCPNLQKLAYSAENTDKLLNQAASEYVNHSRGVLFDGKQLVISSIYKWYIDDFGKSDKGILQHLIKYAKPDLKQKLLDYSGNIANDYDWQLNST